jgi:hypothetical protein
MPIENLEINTLVKTYLHGYKKIKYIGSGLLKNNPDEPLKCMYKYPKDSTMQNDLIVTGGHSILVDNIDDENEYKINFDFFNQTVQIIDDKVLLLACVSNKFVKIEDNNEYNYYHIILENDDDITKRYGIWSNGILTETPSEEYFLQNIV